MTEKGIFNYNNRPSFLKVTFWGSEFFKSKESGASVHIGATIFWPVLNIISSEQEQMVCQIRSWLVAFTIIIALLTVPFYKLRTLPGLWNFIAAIVIFAHLPLLNGSLPSTVHSLLIEVLQLVRIDFLFHHGAGLRD